MYLYGSIIILVIVYVWNMQYNHPQTPKLLLEQFPWKTGDLVLFHAYDNFNATFIGSYFTHCGIVVMDNDVPMLFEANGIENMTLLDHHPKNGIFYSELIPRLQKYKGKTFVRPCLVDIEPSREEALKEFIHYAKQTFYYDIKVFMNGLKKYLGLKRCDHATDCGQITFLSMLCLGILPLEEYNKPIAHHLRYIIEAPHYDSVLELKDHPFGETSA